MPRYEEQDKELHKSKKLAEKRAWDALVDYFNGKGNGPAAKIAVGVIGTLAREEQSRNNARQLDLIEERIKMGGRKMLSE